MAVALAVAGRLLGPGFAAVGWEQTRFYLVRVQPKTSKREVLADNCSITQTLPVLGIALLLAVPCIPWLRNRTTMSPSQASPS